MPKARRSLAKAGCRRVLCFLAAYRPPSIPADVQRRAELSDGVAFAVIESCLAIAIHQAPTKRPRLRAHLPHPARICPRARSSLFRKMKKTSTRATPGHTSASRRRTTPRPSKPATFARKSRSATREYGGTTSVLMPSCQDPELTTEDLPGIDGRRVGTPSCLSPRAGSANRSVLFLFLSKTFPFLSKRSRMCPKVPQCSPMFPENYASPTQKTPVFIGVSR